MPPLTLFEQHHRAGSPLRQEAHCCQSVVSVRSKCREYHPGIRSNAHDSQGTDPMVTEGRYRRSGPICESCLRVGSLKPLSHPSCAHTHSFATLPEEGAAHFACRLITRVDFEAGHLSMRRF